MILNEFVFEKALPIWKKGDTKVRNQSITLVTSVKSDKAVLRIAGSTVYDIFVNGVFCAHGPARCAHGFYRCDEISLDRFLDRAENEIVIKVFGYNVNCYAYLNQSSFVCAEIVNNGEILAYTCEKCHNFRVYLNTERVMKTQRYSFQRAFAEAYELGKSSACAEIELEECESKKFIKRDLPYGEYEQLLPLRVSGCGRVTYSEKSIYQSEDFFKRICVIDGVKCNGYQKEELEYVNSFEYEKCDFSEKTVLDANCGEIAIDADNYADIDFAADRAGHVAMEIEANGSGELFVAFDERELKTGFECLRSSRIDVISIKLEGGKYSFVSAEPYVFKYMRVVAKGTAVKIRAVRHISVAYPASKVKASFIGEDEAMKLIYDAAVNTFRDNTVDIYMDCPSRERAGWLCDSFFTSRVEKTLTGDSAVEKAYLYNFLYQEQDPHLPDGMLPMCYPSDHYDGVHIPNWAMWYVLELDEYVRRSGDVQILTDAKDKLYKLLAHFEKYENEDGLLEKLDGWIFLDWSEANKLVQDVSYPTNMTYALTLETISRMYGEPSLAEKAARIKQAVRAQAMTDSGFFCDNAVRDENGELKLSGKCTEACQYYAFFTETATPETYPQLWKRLTEEFGFERMSKGLYPDVYPANAFIANYVRLETLCRNGALDVLYKDLKEYFTYMAQRTGTLWENNHDRSSLNHGFASHVIYWMEKLGIVKGA